MDGQGTDPAAFDQDLDPVAHGKGFAVEKPQIGQQGRPTRRLGANLARGEAKPANIPSTAAAPPRNSRRRRSASTRR
jgi:hypothetical protein